MYNRKEEDSLNQCVTGRPFAFDDFEWMDGQNSNVIQLEQLFDNGLCQELDMFEDVSTYPESDLEGSEDDLFVDKYLPYELPLQLHETSQEIDEISSRYSDFDSICSRVFANSICYYAVLTAKAVFSKSRAKISEEWVVIISSCLKNSVEYIEHASKLYKDPEFVHRLHAALECYWCTNGEIGTYEMDAILSDVGRTVDKVVDEFICQNPMANVEW